jgi:hypothetical protein
MMKWVFIIIAFAFLIEAVILGIAFIGADEVDCNFLWCEFKTTKKMATSECYQNGVPIDCEEIYDTIDAWEDGFGEDRLYGSRNHTQ